MKVTVVFMILAIVVCAMVQESEQIFWPLSGSEPDNVGPESADSGLSLPGFDGPLWAGHGRGPPWAELRHHRRPHHPSELPPFLPLPKNCKLICDGESHTTTAPEPEATTQELGTTESYITPTATGTPETFQTTAATGK
ncbi:uncharacterized protein LOC105835275 [Monomorium pharaonis]|uniref:uncharacterized protein LOC105835275 n=1 Tax=Monomorium pharaonis TaxID=307658 RepID=UPI00063FAC9A|nr:uncharacterized protein LOC105835275 [Monomorium pharaonis]